MALLPVIFLCAIAAPSHAGVIISFNETSVQIGAAYAGSASSTDAFQGSVTINADEPISSMALVGGGVQYLLPPNRSGISISAFDTTPQRRKTDEYIGFNQPETSLSVINDSALFNGADALVFSMPSSLTDGTTLTLAILDQSGTLFDNDDYIFFNDFSVFDTLRWFVTPAGSSLDRNQPGFGALLSGELQVADARIGSVDEPMMISILLFGALAFAARRRHLA